MGTVVNCSSSERLSHEWSLVASILVSQLPPVFACLPVEWFEDQETKEIWRAATEGNFGLDALREARRTLGFRSLRTLAEAIDGLCLWNVRWHAHEVWRNCRRRDALLRYPSWLRSLAAGEYPETPMLWPAWEAEAIDVASPPAAMSALLSERRARERWVDTHIWWLLSARISERMRP